MRKPMSAEKIVFIGAGKVATVLATALNCKKKIVQVYSRSKASTSSLARKLSCPYTTDLKKLNPDADLYIVAVTDDALTKVVEKLNLKDKTILHTSGSVDMKVLKKVSINCGVFYPLHSFAGNKPLPTNVPFCIEASSPKVKKQLMLLTKALQGKVHVMNSQQRAQLHLAAVFANNFSNHLYAIAYAIAAKSGISFSVLLHLIKESVLNLKQIKPALNQTGPAARGDKETIKRHETMLKHNSNYLAIYKLLSQSIQQSLKPHGAKKL